MPSRPRYLLDLHPQVMEYLTSLKNQEVVKLVYRDHVVIKHSSRKRLASEMQSNSKKLQDMEVPHRAPADAIGDQSNVNLLSKMLVRYMRMASLHLWGPTWTLVDCHGQWLCINRKSHIVNC